MESRNVKESDLTWERFVYALPEPTLKLKIVKYYYKIATNDESKRAALWYPHTFLKNTTRNKSPFPLFVSRALHFTMWGAKSSPILDF